MDSFYRSRVRRDQLGDSVRDYPASGHHPIEGRIGHSGPKRHATPVLVNCSRFLYAEAPTPPFPRVPLTGLRQALLACRRLLEHSHVIGELLMRKTTFIATIAACLTALTLAGCFEGPAGPPGPQGAIGDKGERGVAGVPGEKGEPGTSDRSFRW